MTSEGIDQRTQLAIDVIRNYNGVLKVFKSTRSGATTSYCIACLILGIKFLVLEPTNLIIKESVIRDVKKYANMPDANIIHVPSNFNCIYNQELIDSNNDYGLLPSLPIGGNCKECKYYNECPITEIIRAEDFDGIVLTYDKIIAVKRAAELYPESKAAEILGKISDVRVVILDEAHELAYPRTTIMEYPNTCEDIKTLIKKITVVNKENRKQKRNSKKFPIIELIAKRYLNVLKDPDMLETKAKVNDYFLENHVEWYEKKHAAKVTNNIYRDVITTKWVQDRRTGKMEPVGIDESNIYGYLMEEVMQLMKICKKYEINIFDINSIFDMLNFVTAKEINIKVNLQYDPKADGKYNLFTDIEAVDLNFKRDLTEFIQSMQADYRKILLTSATFPEYDFKDLFYHNTNIQDVIFGENGDPLNANSRMAIFCDTKKYHAIGTNSTKKNMGEIIESCNDIMNIYKSRNCLIICRNIIESERLEKIYKETEYKPEILYYRSPKLMGVKSDYRVMILIGLAYIPSDSYDSICDKVHFARMLAEEKMHCDSWQAISRAKDPEGKQPSVVFALGCTKQDIENVIAWGIGRKVKILDPINGKATEKQVIISGAKISKPKVYDTRDWNKTLVMSVVHMFGLSKVKTISSYKCSNLRNNAVKEYFTVNSKAELLYTIFSKSKYKTQFKYNSGNYSKKYVPMNKEILNEHISGIKEYHFKQILNKKTNTILFECKSEISITKIKMFFDSNNVPYVVEKLNNIYRLWLFIKETTALATKSFAYSVLNEVRIDKTKDCIVEFDDFIRLPFGINSEILVNGEFVTEVHNLNIGIIDIMENEVYKNLYNSDFKLNLQSTDNESDNDEGFCI